MAAELIIASETEQDIAEAYAWYEGRRTGLGEELLSCVDACMEEIRRYQIGSSGRLTAAADPRSYAQCPTIHNYPITFITKGANQYATSYPQVRPAGSTLTPPYRENSNAHRPRIASGT
jgi:hypothetical protein